MFVEPSIGGATTVNHPKWFHNFRNCNFYQLRDFSRIALFFSQRWRFRGKYFLWDKYSSNKWKIQLSAMPLTTLQVYLGLNALIRSTCTVLPNLLVLSRQAWVFEFGSRPSHWAWKVAVIGLGLVIVVQLFVWLKNEKTSLQNKYKYLSFCGWHLRSHFKTERD